MGPLVLPPYLEVGPSIAVFAAVLTTFTITPSGLVRMLGVEPLGVVGVADLGFLIMGCYLDQKG